MGDEDGRTEGSRGEERRERRGELYTYVYLK